MFENSRAIGVFFRVSTSLFFIFHLCVAARAEQHRVPDSQNGSKSSNPVLVPQEPGSPCNIPPSVARALEMQKQVEKANASDLQLLFTELQWKLADLDAENEEAFLQILKAKLATDKQIYKDIKASLDAKKTPAEKGSVELRTSLGKLIGDEKNAGILDDALKMLGRSKKDLIFHKSFKEIRPKTTEVTPLKTLLIYANIVASAGKNLNDLLDCPTFQKIQLLYPTELPGHLDMKTVEKVGLFCGSQQRARQLQIPNAGFIFGGTLGKDGVCRGLDCSAFVSYCTSSKVRLSTMVMEYTARDLLIKKREKANQKTDPYQFTEAEKEIHKEFLQKWGMKEALEEYEVVDVAVGEKPMPGDLVIWRWTPMGKKAKDGHVVLYLEPGKNPGEFLGIEDNRMDDKSDPHYKEGIATDTYKILREKSDTYILRRKKGD